MNFYGTCPDGEFSDESMSHMLKSPLSGKTYKLPPRTVSLIEALPHEYGTKGNALAAIAHMLTTDRDDSRPDLRARLTRMPLPPSEKIVSYEPVPPLEKGETMAQRVRREAAELSKKHTAKQRKRETAPGS